MPNSIHTVLKEVLSDDEFINELATKIRDKIVVQTEDHVVTVEMLSQAKLDIIAHEVDRLIKKGAQMIALRGVKIL